ncbi:hypothetical protein CAPTEDRAFT_219626 [Capitella teleta]|uniref:Phenylalanine--tRNA ligase, mitochondrial n=1 Tax=Capitella teleta TaxID=283909 RepID=R7UPA5_CAPTE|nr:hypothetical protein CAPTEDRAFT_219626 [Capitella teleta]|eukprot:ELU08020.1 hypothetical protein CAPTEDRAFT_219626 [Capitella teleta]
MLIRVSRSLSRPSLCVQRLLRCSSHTQLSQLHSTSIRKSEVKIKGTAYQSDDVTNVTPRILSKIGKNLHTVKHHPLGLIKRRIENYFYTHFTNRVGNPLFAIFDRLDPVVTIHQNFDSLLTPEDHVSRSPKDTYYVNRDLLLRAHTSAHQEEIIKMGCDAFLAVGDVYRRDQIDATHYPVFHQCEIVRLFTEGEVFSRVKDPTGLRIFDEGDRRSHDKQEMHTLEAAKLVEFDLKKCLLGLTLQLFGKDVEYRWVDAYFPFTHPSWELEIFHGGDWLEVLGCGIMEQKLLNNAGAMSKIGWAAGLGLERLAMKLYAIPDIRLFWSEEEAFQKQFRVDNPETPITFKPLSVYAPCLNDISFWVPSNFSSNDFYDLVRTVGGDLVEQVDLVDEFTHPKHQRTSHCYRLVYRHMDRTLTQAEANEIHSSIGQKAIENLGVEIR